MGSNPTLTATSDISAIGLSNFLPPIDPVQRLLGQTSAITHPGQLAFGRYQEIDRLVAHRALHNEMVPDQGSLATDAWFERSGF